MEPDELDYKFYKSNVLILIIMEDTHGVHYHQNTLEPLMKS